MASLEHHLDRLREKPDHVRHRIALFTAAGTTAVVALVWITALATSGTLALKNTSDPVVATKSLAQTKSAFSELMGAVGAAAGATSTDPDLTIVDTKTVTTFDTKIENNTSKTVIPF
jgi:hypothetical protein